MPTDWTHAVQYPASAPPGPPPAWYAHAMSAWEYARAASAQAFAGARDFRARGPGPQNAIGRAQEEARLARALGAPDGVLTPGCSPVPWGRTDMAW